MQIESARAYFDGATSGRRGARFRTTNADANVISYAQLGKLRQRSRDLVRNNAHARRAIEAIVTNTVGDGIRPHFVRNGVRAQEIEDLADVSLETRACDADGMLSYAGIQALALQTAAEGGDVLVRRRWRRPTDGLAVPVQFQVLEPEYLDESRDAKLPDGGRIIQGVEFDRLGRRRAYWLYPEHPGGRYYSGESRPVPARDIAHMLRLERPGQVRGIPWAAPVMLAHADFGDYEDAHIMRQKIAACYAAFIEEPFDTSIPATASVNADGDIVDSIEPGTITRLPLGGKITFGDPPGVDGYGEYSSVTLHKIAAGWGISYEALTGDYSRVNFSSGKMGRLEMQRNISRWRGLMVVPHLCDVLTGWWLEAVALTGVDTTGVTVRHIAPANAMVDPTKEMKAEAEAIRAGQKTWSQFLREHGRDPVEHFTEYREDIRRLDELGITVTTDARVGPAGGAPTPAAPAPDDDDLEDAVARVLAGRA